MSMHEMQQLTEFWEKNEIVPQIFKTLEYLLKIAEKFTDVN